MGENISDPNAPVIKDTIATRHGAAVLSAWTAEGVTYPIDFTKGLLQIQSPYGKHRYKLGHRGIFGTVLRIAQKENINKLFSGLVPMLQRHVIYSGCRHVFYEQYRTFFRDKNGKLSIGMASTGALASGALAQVIATPADMVRIHMQAEGSRILQGKPRKYRTCKECYKRLYAQSGILGLWKGAIPNIGRAAHITTGDMAAYDYCKQFLVQKFGMADNAILHGTSALWAGFVAAILATPADVIRTRIMTQPVGPDGEGLLYKGFIDCVKKSLKNEGILSMYQFFLPLWKRVGPWSFVYWLTFENIMRAIGGKPF